METNVTILYRPVGPQELVLIEQSGWNNIVRLIEVTKEFR